MNIEPVGGKTGWLLAALFLCLAGCETFNTPAPEMERNKAWVQIIYTEKPILFRGRRVDGLTECKASGVCKITLPKSSYPYGCLTHEIVHVFSGMFHDLDKPNGQYCFN